MVKAIEQIVDAYVRYNNRTALDNLKSHRQKLVFDIKARSSGFDRSSLIEQIEEELAFINAGLEKLPPK